MQYGKAFLFLLTMCVSAGLFANNVYDIHDFGAIGNRTQNATMCIQQAIDKCTLSGGGTVVVSPGEYLSSTIVLKDNVTLYLMPGSTLLASNKEEDYHTFFSLDDTGGGGVPMLIFAEGARNISIKGEGKIVGQPEYYESPMEYSPFIAEDCDAAIEAGVPMISSKWKKPNVSLILLSECSDVRIENISLISSPFWTFHAHWCERVSIHGVYIYSKQNVAANADGLDIDGCKNVTISDCIIETADDAICLKTTNGKGGYHNCENVAVSNCILSTSSCALKLGTESYGNFEHILFSNCVIRNSNRAMGIFIRDGGVANDVMFTNMTIECVRKPVGWWGSADAMRFVVLKRNENSKIGGIRNLTISNIIAHCQGSNRFSGFEGTSTIENVKLSNVRLFIYPELTPDKRAKEGLSVSNAKNVSLSDCHVEWMSDTPGPKWSGSFIFENVDNLIANDLVAVNPNKGCKPIFEKKVINSKKIKDITIIKKK